MRTVQTTALTILLLSASSLLHAQSVPTWLKREKVVVNQTCPPIPGTTCVDTSREEAVPTETYRVASQGGITLNSNANPTVSIEVLKYQLWVTNTLSLPITIASGLPVTRAYDVDDVVASVISDAGGVLNARVGGENVKLLRQWWPDHQAYGLFADFYAGVKVTDAPRNLGSGDVSTEYIAGADGRINIRAVLPLTQQARATFNPSERAGTLQLRIQASASRFSSVAYRSLLGPDSLASGVLAANATISLVITDWFYIELGSLLGVSDDALASRQRTRFSFSTRMLR